MNADKSATTLTELRKLAEAAKDSDDFGHEDCYICDAKDDLASALSPERVLALLDVIEAAKRVRANTRIPGDTVTECKVPDCLCHSGADFDAALAAFEKEQGR